MSTGAYRLLRNNEEQGPFTLEELIQKNLKPSDQIWVNGLSTGWNYPGEMTEFKPYAPSPWGQDTNMQYNKQHTPISSSVQAAVAINNNIAQPPAKQQKPRYKVSAAWNKIQTMTSPVYQNVIADKPQKASPKKIIEASQHGNLQLKSLSWEEAWLDWEKEKKSFSPIAEPVKTKKQGTKQSKIINKNYTVPVPETKYATPPDALKDKYTEDILLQEQKTEKRFSTGKTSGLVVPALAVLVIFGVGFWLLQGSNETPAVITGAPAQKQDAPVSNTDKPANPAGDIPANTNTRPVSEEKQDVSKNEQILSGQAEERQSAYMPVVIPADNSKKQITLPGSNSISKDIADQPLQQPVVPVKNDLLQGKTHNQSSLTNTAGLDTAENKTGADINTTNLLSQKDALALKNNHVKTSADYVTVPEYIPITDGNASLKIENVSDVDLDLVVVDVQYFDSLNRFRKGETLYLHNLRAGKNVVIKTPKDINSWYATSKISLISSDSKQLYVVGDN
jgi:hypothetical protein